MNLDANIGPNGEAAGAARELAWAQLQWPSRLYCRFASFVRTTQALLRINFGTLILSWILYSTVILPFTDAARLRLPSGIYLNLSYFVMAGNLVLLLFIRELHFSPGALLFVLYLTFSGVYGISVAGEQPGLFAKEWIGLSVSVVFYTSFFRGQTLPASRIFELYVNVAACLSAVALIIYAIEIMTGYHDPFGVRLHYPIQEPAHFAEATVSALYYAAWRWLRKPQPGQRRPGGAQFFLLAIANVLAASSVAFIGILLCIVFLMSRSKKLMIIAPILLAALAGLIYMLFPGVQMRADDALAFLVQQDLSQARNVSVFILAKCAYVAFRGFLSHPIFGNGIGAYRMIHDNFLRELGVGGYLSSYVVAQGNADDANSMFLRLLAELGSVGIILCAIFILRFRVHGSSERAAMSSGILIFFLIALLREGAYLLPPTCFLFVAYAMLWQEEKSASQAPVRNMA